MDHLEVKNSSQDGLLPDLFFCYLLCSFAVQRRSWQLVSALWPPMKALADL